MRDDFMRTADVRFGAEVLEDVFHKRPINVEMSPVLGTISPEDAEKLADVLDIQSRRLRAAAATVRAARGLS